MQYLSQAYIQTNDDNIDREIQTDDIESSEKWCQHPQEDFCASGSPEEDEKQSEADTKPVDHARFSKFIQSSGRVSVLCVDSYKCKGFFIRKILYYIAKIFILSF